MQAYDRRDANSILSYLQSKAEEISNGQWTDFSNGDIGTILLKLIAYMADMNNYQIDKGLSELYIDTLHERESALSLVKLIGYEPKGYKSARVSIDLSLEPGYAVENGTIIPRYSVFTDDSRNISFCNVKEQQWYANKAEFVVFEGNYSSETRVMSEVDENARLYLNAPNIDIETMTLSIAGDVIARVDNVLTDISNQLKYSVHISSDSKMYIQLPSYWKDLLSTSSSLKIEYLLTQGATGNIGSHILTKVYNTINAGIQDRYIKVDNNLASTGAADPESIEEIQKGAPMYASTMNTLVTLEDIQLAKYEVDGVSDIIALDYNTPESGLVQPADAYKVNVYVLPTDNDYIVDPGGELTDVGKALKEFIDERRLTSIMIEYKNVEILTPEIKIEAYINKYDIRADSLASDIKNIILEKYDRSVFKIGEGIYSSKLSKQILDEINYCNYIEVQLPDDSYIPTRMQFLEVTEDNIIVNVVEE